LSIMQLLFSLSPRNHYTNFIQPLILLLDRTYAIFMTVMLLRMMRYQTRNIVYERV